MPLPDEGLIHAWLDGQLPPEEAERVERLVSAHPAWAAAVAEARGLVAASSRILAALDAVPSGVLPAGSTKSRSAHRLPWWTKAAAAVVIIVGGSTLVMQRVPAPTITEVPKAPVPVANVPVTSPATSPVTSPATSPTALPVAPSAAETRRDIAKSTPPVASATTAKAAPVMAVPANQPQPQMPASIRERAEAPAAALAQRQESRAAGGVASGSAGALQAQRVADQRMDMQRAAEQQAGAQRDAAAPVMAKGEAQSTMNQAAKALVGVAVTGAPAAPPLTVGACYAMRDSRTSAATGIVMRGEKQVADTLFLAPLRPSLPARGWVVLRDGVLRGVLTTEAEGRGMVLVTAAAVPCTTP